MRVLVCGGRKFDDRDLLDAVLDGVTYCSEIIHGGATGADLMAACWARRHNIACRPFPAQWIKYGRAAGPIRNGQMLAESRPELVIAFPGGPGTADLIARAKAKGIAVLEIGRC